MYLNWFSYSSILLKSINSLYTKDDLTFVSIA